MPMNEQEEFEFRKRMEDEARLKGNAVSMPEIDIPPSELDSAISGLAQGTTMGFSDELGGAKDAALGALSKLSLSDVVKDYIASRNERRAANDAAQKANPWSYTAGELTGGVGTALIPGVGLAGEASALAKAAQAAKLGAVAGAGYSKEEDLGGVAKDVAIGAVTAPVVDAAISKAVVPGIKKAYGAIEPLVEPVVDKITKPARVIKDSLFKQWEASPNAKEIVEAAKRQGIDEKDIPGWLLTNDPEAQKAADMLMRSGRIGGSFARDKMAPVTNAIKSGTEDLLEDATGKSPTMVGQEVKEGVREAADSMMAPIQAKYDVLENQLSGNRLPEDVIPNIRQELSMIADDPGNFSDAEKVVTDLMKRMDKVKTVGDLKRVRTRLDGILPEGSSKNAKHVVGEIRDILTKYRNQAFDTADDRISEFYGSPKINASERLAGIDKEYAQLANEIQNALGSTKRNQGAMAPVEKLEDLSPELVRKTLNLFQKPEQLAAFKEKFPEQFELLRRAELARIKSSATPPHGDVIPGRAVQEIFGSQRGEPRYQPEVQDILLGDKVAQGRDLKVLNSALPPDYNPSHTASGNTWMGMITNPMDSAGSFARYMQLKMRSPKVSDVMVAPNLDSIVQKLSKNPNAQKYIGALRNAQTRGASSVAATHFILSQTDPDYQKAVSGEEDEQNN